MKTTPTFFFVVCVLFLFSVTSPVSAYLGAYPFDSCVNIGTNLNTTQVNFSLKYPNSTFAIINEPMNYTPPSSFDYYFCNTTTPGLYIYNYKDLEGNTYQNSFRIGQEVNLPTAFIQSFLLLFFIFLGFIYYSIRQKIDFDKWNNRLISQYEHKNFVKLVLGALAFNLMKHAFIIYYLIGLPIITGLVDFAQAYGLANLLQTLTIILYIYLTGVILVALIFLSFVQEWIMDLMDQLKNMKWGV